MTKLLFKLSAALIFFIASQNTATADGSLPFASKLLHDSKYKEAICEYEKIIYSEIDSNQGDWSHSLEKYTRALAISDFVFVLLRSQLSENSANKFIEHDKLEKPRKANDLWVTGNCEETWIKATVNCLSRGGSDCPNESARDICPRYKIRNGFSYERVDFGPIGQNVKIQSASAQVVETLQRLLKREKQQFPLYSHDRDESAFVLASSKIPRLCEIPKEEEPEEYSD